MNTMTRLFYTLMFLIGFSVTLIAMGVGLCVIVPQW